MKNFAEIKHAWANFNWFSDRAINSLKTAIACVIGYLIYLFTPLPQAQWIVITVLVVMSAQISIGGVLIKSYMRFLGTVAGALIAVGAFLLGGTEPIWIACILFTSTLVFAYIGGSPKDISAAGILGAVTIVMVLLNPHVTIAIAGVRFLEITLGIVIACLVSSLVWPMRAHTLLIKSFARTLNLLKQHVQYYLLQKVDDKDTRNYNLEQSIVSSFNNQRKLIHELNTEPGKFYHQKQLFQPLLDTLVKIYRVINLMYYSANSTDYCVHAISELKNVAQFKMEVINFLQQLSDALGSGKKTQINVVLAELIDYMEHGFKQIAHEKPYEYVACVNTYLFGARLLMTELKKLAELIEGLL